MLESKQKMNLSNPIEILNLDNFLPLDGESKIEMFYIDRVLNLDIFYNLENSDCRLAKHRICFYQAKYFFKTPIPGYSFFICSDDRNLTLLNSLVEYEHSDMLDLEQKTSGGVDYKHYRLFLHSTGVALHVIAQSFDISSEEIVD